MVYTRVMMISLLRCIDIDVEKAGSGNITCFFHFLLGKVFEEGNLIGYNKKTM